MKMAGAAVDVPGPAPMSDLDNTDEIVSEFLVESHENLDRLDRELLVLEKEPGERSVLASIFRTIHTIKGTAGFLGFSKLESLTHVGENLLGRLRDGELSVDPEIATALLRLVDGIRQMLASVERSGNESDGDYSRLSAELTRLHDRPGQGAAPAPAPAAKPASPPAAKKAAPAPKPASPQATQTMTAVPVFKSTGTFDALRTTGSGEVFSAEGGAAAGSSVADNSIRVDVRLLDRLMNLVGELVLARNQILQIASEEEDGAFQGTCQRLNLITSELQEGVMKTRMQPIGNVWSRFPRVVRDLALSCGKQVAVEMEGADTELDKTIIEAIKDPLTHLVRNAVDHGIEAPELRVQRGKSREGRLRLRAYHEGGKVNIEIRDDGGGIDVDKVKARAVQRGMLGAEEAERLNDREAMNLIFLPGFSTAEKITNVSGRGVGMDVVKTNIEKIGGTVDLSSTLGEGSAVMIRIPLTLAIIPALIITSGGGRYAIPQVSLVELVRLDPDQARTAIEFVHGTPVYRLRGNLLPVVSLGRTLGDESGEGPLGLRSDEAVNMVVLQSGDRQFGLVVASINDTEEIVVKPLSKQLKGTTAFAGATIMGDGKVALILDVSGIAQRAGVVSEMHERALPGKAEGQAVVSADEKQTLLLCAVGGGSRLAIPLSKVARLEEFATAQLEALGEQPVIQYRGQILPLLRLSAVLVERRRAPREAQAVTGRVQVIVHNGPRGSVGLVVDQILDIVEESFALQRPASRPGVLGSAVIQGRVTELLDMEHAIAALESHSPYDAEEWKEVA
ncbi:MAG TPA: chemotaxis protein CheW [Polyangia bacterium]|nr:chemotaxis protein CheW [Polyangia bacterium]